MEGRRWVFARRLTSELLKLKTEYALVQVDEDEDEDINMGGLKKLDQNLTQL